MDYTDFEDFNSPAGGVELSDTLADWRKKTNGIIMELDLLKDGSLENNSVALEKIAQVENLKVLGNTSGSTGNVSEVSILHEDTLSSDSATALATQQSIKAYIDSLKYSTTYRHILANATAWNGGFVNESASLEYNTLGIFDSDNTADPSTLDWSDILPMQFASNVEKTIIRAQFNWDQDGSTHDDEEMTHAIFVIDWENSEISASCITNTTGEDMLYLKKTTIASGDTEYPLQVYALGGHGTTRLKIAIEGSTKTITKFPFLILADGEGLHEDTPKTAQYEIENHIRG